MTIPPQINTLIFDLDGTLTYQYPTSLDIMFTLLDEHQIPIRATAHRETLQYVFQYWANSDEFTHDKEKYGKFSEEHWVQYLPVGLTVASMLPTVSKPNDGEYLCND